jgi:fructose-1,6-bisphosphatase-3
MSNLQISQSDLPFLRLLSEKFPTIAAASAEIINLQAILNLPKGTEHFLSDIHGEYDSFQHVIKNASGVIKGKIKSLFEITLTSQEREELTFLIYYPEEILQIKRNENKNLNDWYAVTLFRLIQLCRESASKYTRSKVRKALPKEFAYIIDELLNEQGENKHEYYNQIIKTIIELRRAESFIIEISKIIQRFSVDHLHILGDIFDRGSSPHLIMDLLEKHHSFDIQWGNHDILWMGAGAGSLACITNLLRISFRYGNIDTIEDGYGINLRPLWKFALDTYKDDPCLEFMPKENNESENANNLAKISKAVAILQFKLEAELIKRRPAFDMEDRLLLEKIDYTKGRVVIDGNEYELSSCNFPTIDPENPNKLSPEEKHIVKQLKETFITNEKLQRHIQLLLAKGSLYKTHNNNLLFHGCILLNEDGSLKKLPVQGKEYTGKKLMDKFDRIVRQGCMSKDIVAKKYGEDIMWYLWSGVDSPLFGKKKMATFERLFIKDKETHVEEKNPYYEFRNDEKTCKMLLEEFGLNPEKSHIFNGHVPVKTAKGESPVKANGRLIVIDGGFSRAYQKVTGIAGYTLIANSHGLTLTAHQPFVSKDEAINKRIDIDSQRSILETSHERIRVKDTDTGSILKQQITDLKKLLYAYSHGDVKEKL